MSELSLEMYARLLAHVACRRGARLSDLLSELGIDAEALPAAEIALREQLTSAWVNRRGILAMKFAAALGAELQRLGPIGGDGASPLPPEVVSLLSTAPEVPETAMPSYLHTPLTTDRGGIGAPPFVALPAAPSLPAAPPIAPPALIRKEPASPSTLAGTGNLDLTAIVAAIRQGGLPFAHAPSPQAGATPAPEGRPGSATPDAGPAEAREELPLETFALVSGALARGESRDVALARHGLTSAAFDVLAKAWAQRFQREPQLLDRFKELARSSAATGRPGEGQR